jgi:hypothetical protein
MRVNELIAVLSKMDPDMEVVLYRPGGHNSPSYSTTRMNVVPGYLVRDPESSGSFYTKAKGNGLFVDEASANRVMADGQRMLDLTSPTIHPAVQLDLPPFGS